MTRDEIIEQLDGIVGTYEILFGHGVNSDILDADDIEAIKEAISLLSTERKKGNWTLYEKNRNWKVCSACGALRRAEGFDDYCSACGADMRGDT